MSQPTIDRETVLVRRSTFVSSEMDQDLMLMSTESNAYFGLDDIGKVVWEMLEAPLTVDSLCTRLRSRYEVDEAQCLADLIPFLESLVSAGIVSRG